MNTSQGAAKLSSATRTGASRAMTGREISNGMPQHTHAPLGAEGEAFCMTFDT